MADVRGTVDQIRSTAVQRGSPKVQVCVDFVAYAPHRRIDVQAFDIDFGVFSYYKVSTALTCRVFFESDNDNPRSMGHTFRYCTRARKHTHLSHLSHTTSLIKRTRHIIPHLSSFNRVGRAMNSPMDQQQCCLISSPWAELRGKYQKERHLLPHLKGLRRMKPRF